MLLHPVYLSFMLGLTQVRREFFSLQKWKSILRKKVLSLLDFPIKLSNILSKKNGEKSDELQRLFVKSGQKVGKKVRLFTCHSCCAHALNNYARPHLSNECATLSIQFLKHAMLLKKKS